MTPSYHNPYKLFNRECNKFPKQYAKINRKNFNAKEIGEPWQFSKSIVMISLSKFLKEMGEPLQ
jgi:hypothetical protein